jgi:hypothetical protein
MPRDARHVAVERGIEARHLWDGREGQADGFDGVERLG